MGLESDSTASSTGFVDTYGSAFGRDVEPTQARTINKTSPPFSSCMHLLHSDKSLFYVRFRYS